MKKKNIALLGSTGSIGTQTLEVIKENSTLLHAYVLTANNNCDLLIAQALIYKPSFVVIGNEKKYVKVKQALSGINVTVLSGKTALVDVVQLDDIDVVLTALVGYSGLLPTISAIKAKKTIALANKETLVVGGDLITRLCKKNNTKIYPVDSEHSAIFQCLVGEEKGSVEKIYLTASGGPFFGKERSQLESITKKEALKHPNWEMGAKITIDSASLMNKGLELIEAKWLFDLRVDQIEVVIHPQSIIHSAVQFVDGSVIAQLGVPDMKLPIQYSLTHPVRTINNFKRFSFLDYPNLTFNKPDIKTFRNLELAYFAIKRGGNIPCVLNAANEIAVEAFLNDRISFLNMPDLIADCMEKITFVKDPNISDYIETNNETRELAKKLL